MKPRILLILIAALFLGADPARRAKNTDANYSEFDAKSIIPLPDIQQPDDYSCGAAAFMSIASYYGAKPEELDDYKRKLHTTSSSGTSYTRIVEYAEKLQFAVTLHEGGMSDDDLRKALDAKHPVILSIQAYATDPDDYDVTPDDRKDKKHNRNGHFVVAIGYDKANVYFMDPSLTGRRGYLSWKDLDKRWHDNEGTFKDPKVFVRLGIVIDPKKHEPAYPHRARKID